MLLDFVTKLLMFWRIRSSKAAAQHGDGSTAGRKRASVRGCIDASCQPADDREP
jgi:hypothetical protein